MTELMVVVVIIGILSTVAIPAYKNYIIDSKIAEAYSSVDAIMKSQNAYFADRGEFYSLSPNPVYVTNSMKIESNPDWAEFGYSIPQDSNVFFSYQAYAGQIDNSGAAVDTSTITGHSFEYSNSSVTNADIDASTSCNRGGNGITAEAAGVNVQNNLNWVVVTATGNLNGDSADQQCTAVIKVTQTDPTNNQGPASGGFVILHKGH